MYFWRDNLYFYVLLEFGKKWPKIVMFNLILHSIL